MIGRRTIAGAMLGAIAAPLTATSAQIRDLHMIVGAGTGGSSDISTRILAAYLTENGLTSRVSNRAAGNGVEAAIHVMRLPANSDTVLSNGLSGIHLAPARERLAYNADSFEPVCMFSTAAFVLAVRSGTFNNIHELITKGKTVAGISIAQGGVDTQYFVDVFAEASGTNVANVTYRSGGDAIRDLIAGVVDAAYVSMAAASGFARTGEVKFLAHTLNGINNIPGFDDIPHISSIGSNHPGLISYHYHGLYAPKTMPSDIIASIALNIQRVCASQTFINDHLSRGMMVAFKGPNELKQHHEVITKNMVEPFIEWTRRRR